MNAKVTSQQSFFMLINELTKSVLFLKKFVEALNESKKNGIKYVYFGSTCVWIKKPLVMILKEIFRSLNNINGVSVPRISSFSV